MSLLTHYIEQNPLEKLIFHQLFKKFIVGYSVKNVIFLCTRSAKFIL